MSRSLLVFGPLGRTYTRLNHSYRTQHIISLGCLPQRIWLYTANPAIVGEIDTEMIRRCEANDLKVGTGTKGDVHRQEACAYGHFANAALDQRALRDRSAAHHPVENLWQRIPEAIEWQ